MFYVVSFFWHRVIFICRKRCPSCFDTALRNFGSRCFPVSDFVENCKNIYDWVYVMKTILNFFYVWHICSIWIVNILMNLMERDILVLSGNYLNTVKPVYLSSYCHRISVPRVLIACSLCLTSDNIDSW